MSNATDAKLWHGMSTPNLPSPLQATGLHVAQPNGRGATPGSVELHNALSPSEATGLAMLLRHLFGGQGNQIFWGIPSSDFDSSPAGGDVARIDPRHRVERMSSGTSVDSKESQSNRLEPVLVIVDHARRFGMEARNDQLAALAQTSPRLVLIAYESDESGPQEEAETSRSVKDLVDLSRHLGLAYVGPMGVGDSRQLLDTLSQLKDSARPSLLHLKSHRASAVDLDVVPSARSMDLARDRATGRTYRQSASAHLAEQAKRDARITVVADADAEFLCPWLDIPDRVVQIPEAVDNALHWCAALALEGGRPFLFTTLAVLQDSFGVLRREVCAKRAPVTLLLESHDWSSEQVAPTAALAAIRQLANLCVVAPKDVAELSQMIDWSAGHDGPVVIWLPDAQEPRMSWSIGPPLELGRAEELSTGSHVALIAWGPMVAAAQLAADSMAADGITANIVNARFAQPLDRDALSRAARAALCTVVIDYDDSPSGFSSWVLNHFARDGIAQPVALIAPADRTSPNDPRDAHQRCALRIVEHCSWLAEPVGGGSSGSTERLLPVVAPETAFAGAWLSPSSTVVRDGHDEQRQVLAQQFSPFIESWIGAYEKVGKRDIYLWRWCLHGLNLTTLPCVAPELRAHVCDTKLLSIILCVLLDDVADQHGDGRLLGSLLQMACCGVCPTWKNLSDSEREHGDVTRAVWEAYWSRIAAYPCRSAFEPVLHYDLSQFFNTMRYSHLVNGRPYLLNLAEHDSYTPHNMMMISFATLDLMCSPGFPESDVAPLREAVWHAQCMGRIGNLLSTWRRELADRDLTSGVFARAVCKGDLSLDELKHGDAARLEAAIRGNDHEAYFFHQWHEHRRQCHALARRIRSVNLESVLEGHDRFFAMHLGSQGLI